MADDPRDGMGGNLPPVTLDPEIIRARLIDSQTALLDRVNDIDAGGSLRLPETIESQDQAERVAEFGRQCKIAADEAEAQQKIAVLPYQLAADAVKGFFGSLVARIIPARAKANRLLLGWDERVRAEAAAAEAKAAAERATAAREAPQTGRPAAPPPPPPPAPGPVRSEHGAVASFRDRTIIEVTDATKVPRALCSPDMAKIKARLKAYPDKAIPGVTTRKGRGVANIGG